MNVEALVRGEPIPEQGFISSGVDFYKPTMSQLAYEQEPDAEVTFTFCNRGAQTQRLLDYVDPNQLRERFEELQDRSWQPEEVSYLGSLRGSDGQPRFAAGYLDYLLSSKLPDVVVSHDRATDDIAIETTGPFPLSTFWETVVMGQVNEAYTDAYMRAHNLDPADVYAEGDRRLSEKIAILQDNPDIKIIDFGTRRHFSLGWQKHVLGRALDECPENIVGTSNVALADSFGIQPIGTFAHEMPMVYAALADARGGDIRGSHNKFLQDWFKRYGPDLSVALSDTFGSEFFFSDFSEEQAQAWRGPRHDSGPPMQFGERTIRYYQERDIDPESKSIVFSDGLDIHPIVMIRDHFLGRIGKSYGWGTKFMNDLGIPPLNIVMKATHVRLPATGQEASTVKLSDDEGKEQGRPQDVARYKEIFLPA